jgi:hypothetical protein
LSSVCHDCGRQVSLSPCAARSRTLRFRYTSSALRRLGSRAPACHASKWTPRCPLQGISRQGGKQPSAPLVRAKHESRLSFHLYCCPGTGGQLAAIGFAEARTDTKGSRGSAPKAGVCRRVQACAGVCRRVQASQRKHREVLNVHSFVCASELADSKFQKEA